MTKPHLFSTDAHKYRSFLAKGMHSPSFVIGGVITLFFVILALLSFVWTPHDALSVNITERLMPISTKTLAGHRSLWP